MEIKKWISIGLTASLISGMTACAKTPDSNIVSQKNNERLKEAAQQEPTTENTLAGTAETTQEHYDYSYENQDKTLTIHADAQVSLPDKDTIPMYEVSSSGYSQELVTAVYNYFFQDTDTYTYQGTNVTKDICEEKILYYKQKIAEIPEDERVPEDEKESLIENMEEQLEYWSQTYETAPEESTLEKVPVDSTLTWIEGEPTGYWGINCQSDTGIFSVTNAEAGDDTWSSMAYLRTNKDYEYSGLQGVELVSEEEIAKAESEIGLSYDEARKTVEDFFQTIGVEGKICASSAIAGMSGDFDENEDTPIQTADQYTAYRFFYARTVDDIPLAVTSSESVSEDESAAIWCYEKLEMIIDKDGIVDFSWNFPVEIDNTVSENVGIISFKEASEIFEQIIPIIYEGELEECTEEYSMTIDVNVNQVNLALMRVRDSGGERTGLMTPTWVFYGSVTEYHTYIEEWEDWEDASSAPWIVLAVNAVDGSVIDVTEGY